jgi:peptidoglycan/xylan/chitin deacetylase (PgdA/CDA1 family)
MLIPGISRLRRTARRFRNTIAPGGLILLYHRVTEVDCDPWSLCVTPQHFAEHLEILLKNGYPMRLQQLNQALQARKRLPRAIAVTFDDGYADNLHNAKPLLERYDLPATVFVVSGYVGHQREFWWDELERLLLQPGTLPESLCLHINDSPFRWRSGESAHFSADNDQHHRSWYINQDAPSPRHSLYDRLWKLLSPLLEDERRSILDQLLVWSGAEPVSRSTHRHLSPEELLTLNQGELIEVGSHTVTHPFLSTLPTALQRDEIQHSKACLEQIIGHPVKSFAYPHGDYTLTTVGMVREAGFACACSVLAGSVRGRTDRFQLPRVVVQDWDGEEFARRLSRWFRD